MRTGRWSLIICTIDIISTATSASIQLQAVNIAISTPVLPTPALYMNIQLFISQYTKHVSNTFKLQLHLILTDTITQCFIKRIHLFSYYNSRIFSSIFVICVLLETGMNTLPSRHKQCQFNLTISPLNQVKLKNSTKTANRLLQCVLSTDCFKLSQKVVQCSFLSVC